jgi:hypothetical protein
MNNLPKRGPRVMHGLGALMAKARTVGNVAPVASLPEQEAQLMKDTETVVNRLVHVSKLTSAYREQAKTMPEDNLFRVTIEKMLDSYDRALGVDE